MADRRDRRARRRSPCRATRRGGCIARSPTRATSTTGSSRRRSRGSSRSPAGCSGRTAAPSRSSRRPCATPSPTASPASAKATTARAPRSRASAASRSPADRGERPVGPIAPERFGVLQALLAHVLSACGEERDARLDADDLAARFSIPREELQETLSLLNLVNFGGGCYTVYAEVDEDEGVVRVDKELYGDVFRQAAEADAARGARDPPRDRLRRPDDRGRGAHAARPCAEEARGDVRAVRSSAHTDGQRRATPRRSSCARSPRRSRSGASSRSSTSRRATRVRRRGRSSRTRSSESCPCGACTRGTAPPTGRARIGSTGCAPRRLTDESFEPRDGFDPRYLDEPRLARLWHSPVVARWKVERGARLLTDKAALSELPFKTDEWLLSEVLADAGETIVLEPADMRASVAARAKELQVELGLSPRRKRPAARA